MSNRNTNFLRLLADMLFIHCIIYGTSSLYLGLIRTSSISDMNIHENRIHTYDASLQLLLTTVYTGNLILMYKNRSTNHTKNKKKECVPLRTRTSVYISWILEISGAVYVRYNCVLSRLYLPRVICLVGISVFSMK